MQAEQETSIGKRGQTDGGTKAVQADSTDRQQATARRPHNQKGRQAGRHTDKFKGKKEL